MSRRYRIGLLSVSFLILIVVGYIIEGSLYILFKSFWFTSGFLLMILLSLVDQPFFSKDSNIFVNAITAALSLMIIPLEKRDFIFYLFLTWVVYLLISSYLLMIIRKNSLKNESIGLQFFSRLNRVVGKPEVLFSAFFLWGALVQYNSSALKLGLLLLLWSVFTVLNVPEIAKTIESLFANKANNRKESIGSIMGVQATNTFLVKLKTNYKKIELFKLVEFMCSSDGIYKRGLVYESMLLDQEQWIKVITSHEIDELCRDIIRIDKPIDDIVYLIEESVEESVLNRFVGIVSEGSHIGKIKFLFTSRSRISEGDMLEAFVNEKKVLYQVIEARTHLEVLTDKNLNGFIVGEAIQLGTWNKEKLQFEKFGWVPNMNSPVYIASNIEKTEIDHNEILVGTLPGTNYPVVLNKEIAITHHMAVIGVTGTGKSIFSRNLIRRYSEDPKVKVICIDFTGEYSLKLADIKPQSIIMKKDCQSILQDINWIDLEEGKFSNQRDHIELDKKKKSAESKIINSIEEYLKSDSKVAILELPEVENTSGVMTYTQYFFRALFKIAKSHRNYGNKVCLVLEEAHTIIPEWNSSGISEKTSQPLINSIAQIALQGRKYEIGLLVIAQRTANVSKTILTQCNSIISFQEYDKTSIDFLANYFGQEISGHLNELKFRHAVAAGKAFKSNVPMIFEIPEITENCEDQSQELP